MDIVTYKQIKFKIKEENLNTIMKNLLKKCMFINKIKNGNL